MTCDLKPLSGQAWVPSRIDVHFSPDFGSATVTDVAFSVSVPALVVQKSENSFVLTWKLPELAVMPNGWRQEPEYRAVLNKANQKMSIQASARGGRAKPVRGAGRCQQEGSLPMVADGLPG